MATALGPWVPLAVPDVAALLREVQVPWWIAGGWAIDLFVGRQTRPHGDIDVFVLRPHQLAIQAALAGGDLHAADPPGTLRPWRPGERLDAPIIDIWCRRTPATPWSLQLMLGDTDADRWVFRRDHRVSGPLSQLTCRTPDGVPFLAPEVQLLYKAKAAPLPKDEADFTAAVPLLDEGRRRWLVRALRTYDGRHPWLTRL